MPDFERASQKFITTGVDLAHPPDLMPAGRYPILKNIRSVTDGVIETRAGMIRVNATPIPQPGINSIRRLNDSNPAAALPWTRVIGAGSKLYSGQDVFVERDSGYSTEPLSMVPVRPDNSPEAWMYIADSLRMRKMKVDGTDYLMGIAPPTAPPTVEVGAPLYKAVDEMQAVGTWLPTAPAGAISNPFRVSVTTTAATILYDTGINGWCSIKPTNVNTDFSFFGIGARYVINGAEESTLEEIHAPISTTIGSIAYDTGTTGYCTIQPATPVSGYQRNALVQLPGGTPEYVRILSVTDGPDGLSSFRCFAVNAHAAGEAITGFVSFRFYFYTSVFGAFTITSKALRSTITVTPPATSATGYITSNLAAPLDLSSVSGRPLQLEDYIHVSVQIDNLANVSEGRILLDIDAATNATPAGADFTKNYFYKSFRANDFVQAAQGTISAVEAQQRGIQRQIIDASSVDQTSPANVDSSVPTSDQTFTGNSQWSELIFKVSDLVRVGGDTSVTLAAVKALRISLTVTATTVLTATSWWIGGAYGPDTGLQGAPIKYRFRYRSSATGAKSLQSPATRYGVDPKRQRVVITPTASGDPQVDKIDIERFGGALNEWHWIASVANASSAVNDDSLDADIVGRPPLETDVYQPFPITDLPRAGTCNVAGTAVAWVSGDVFNLNWAPGIDVIIDGVPFTLYAQPSSTTKLQTVQNVGSKTAVSFSIPNPTIMGQPLQRMWGPYGEGTGGLFLFAVGDPLNPGTIYCTKGNDPDAAPDTYQIEATSPSEEMQNGVMYGGRSFAASSERWFELRPKFGSSGSGFPFAAQEMAVGRGLFSPWALAVGPMVYFLGKDGIYQTNGGPATSITDDTLYPLFPHEGQPGIAVNGFEPPDMTTTAYLRLAYYDGWLYFTYRLAGDAGEARTLVYNTAKPGWFPYSYQPGILVHYGEEGDRVHSLLLGSAIGNLLQESGIFDDESAIDCQVRTPAFNAGDTRADKLFGDAMVDFETGGANLSVVPGFDNYTSLIAAATLNSAVRTQDVIDLLSGLGKFAKNVQLDFTWQSFTGVIKLYEWQPSFLKRPEDTLKRATDNDDAGFFGSKYVRAALVEADTEGLDRTVQIIYDGTNVGATLAVNHDGQLIKPYPIPSPFVAHLLRTRPTDANKWRLFRVAYVFDKYPELSAIMSEWTDAGYQGAKFMQGFKLKGDTGGIPAGLQIQYDEGALAQTFTVNHAGQVTKPYVFTEPFIAHNLRTVPTGNLRTFSVEWIFEPAPELVTTYITQFTDHDMQSQGRVSQGAKGYQSFRYAYISLISLGDSTMGIVDDRANTFPYTIPSTAGLHRKPYVPLLPMKGKLFQYRITCPAGLRLFEKDSEVAVKSWGDDGAYKIVRPFGDISRQFGARI